MNNKNKLQDIMDEMRKKIQDNPNITNNPDFRSTYFRTADNLCDGTRRGKMERELNMHYFNKFNYVVSSDNDMDHNLPTLDSYIYHNDM